MSAKTLLTLGSFSLLFLAAGVASADLRDTTWSHSESIQRELCRRQASATRVVVPAEFDALELEMEMEKKYVRDSVAAEKFAAEIEAFHNAYERYLARNYLAYLQAMKPCWSKPDGDNSISCQHMIAQNLPQAEILTCLAWQLNDHELAKNHMACLEEANVGGDVFKARVECHRGREAGRERFEPKKP